VTASSVDALPAVCRHPDRAGVTGAAAG